MKSALLLALLLPLVQAFQPATPRARTTFLQAGVAAHHESQYLMARAREVALSDAATASEARRYLQEILHIESACISGALTGSPICDDVADTAEVVARLRQKIETGGGEDSLTPQVNLLAIVVFVGVVYLTARDPQGVPLQWQEVVWSMQGGYFDDLVWHFLRNGGL